MNAARCDPFALVGCEILKAQIRADWRALGEEAAQMASQDPVTRNRARRRLRAVAEEILPRAASAGYDYVLIGRKGTIARDFAALKKDLVTGLEKLGALRELDKDNDARTGRRDNGTAWTD